MNRSEPICASPPAARSPRPVWILGTWRDLLLFVATPLAILPIFSLAMRQWSGEEIALFVFAFGQLGHNLPGMMRAYGDRDLFQRHKIRFLVAPVALLVVSGFFIHGNLKGLILISATWGIWHALMQTYGLMRIYDAKYGSFAKTTQRLDLAMCISWFGLAVLMSHGRLVLLLDLFFTTGGPLQVAALIQPLSLLWMLATSVITLMFLAHLIRRWSEGRAPNPVKLLLMVTSFSFYWFTSVSISNVLLGLAMFEVFHDVQYLAIVWIFNRNRVKGKANVGSFTRFLFRRSGALIGLYLGLIFAYGSLYYLEHLAAAGRLKEMLTAMLATSALLHYYYDGFIWKIRDQSTRESFEITTKDAQSTVSGGLPTWAMHALKWLAFGVPLCWLFHAETTNTTPDLVRLVALRDAVPSSADTHLRLADALQIEGNHGRAIDEYRAAHHYRLVLQLDPSNAAARNKLEILQKLGHE